MKKVFGLVTLLLLLVSCHRNPLKVDVSDIDIKLNIKRLDRDFFQLNPDNLASKLPELKQYYGSFFDTYNQDIIALGSPSDSLYSTYLMEFLADTIRVQSRQKVDSVFNDLSGIEKKLADGFRHYKHYFPQRIIPQVYTMISGFNQSVVLTRDAVGISLDNYLGTKCPYYAMLAIPHYKRENMRAERIPADVLYSWGISEFEFDDSKDNLLANMIYQGKMLYFLDAMFPEDPDYLKIGFSPEKLDWCLKNEAGIWTYLVEHKLLFTTERMNIVRFIGPAPFTSAFTTDSPGRAGVWLGWQIVRKYMDKNRQISLQTLMADNDFQKILNESGYSPAY